MVLLRSLFHFSLGGLGVAHGLQQDSKNAADSEALTSSSHTQENNVLRARAITGLTGDIDMFHRVVRHARRAVEDNTSMVQVSHKDLHEVLDKLKDLENQVNGMLSGSKDSTSASTTLGSIKDDCSVERLLLHVAPRSLKDGSMNVSDHPLFSRTNCDMQAIAASQKSGSSSADSSSSDASSGQGFETTGSKDITPSKEPSGSQAAPGVFKAVEGEGPNFVKSSKPSVKAPGAKYAAEPAAKVGDKATSSGTIETMPKATITGTADSATSNESSGSAPGGSGAGVVKQEFESVVVESSSTGLSTLTITMTRTSTISIARVSGPPKNPKAAVKNSIPFGQRRVLGNPANSNFTVNGTMTANTTTKGTGMMYPNATVVLSGNPTNPTNGTGPKVTPVVVLNGTSPINSTSRGNKTVRPTPNGPAANLAALPFSLTGFLTLPKKGSAASTKNVE